jgi:hypothetical protein
MQRPQHAFKGFAVAAMIVSQATAGAGQLRPGMIAGVGVQSLFQSLRGEPQNLASRRHLQGLEIQFGHRLRT